MTSEDMAKVTKALQSINDAREALSYVECNDEEASMHMNAVLDMLIDTKGTLLLSVTNEMAAGQGLSVAEFTHCDICNKSCTDSHNYDE